MAKRAGLLGMSPATTIVTARNVKAAAESADISAQPRQMWSVLTRAGSRRSSTPTVRHAPTNKPSAWTCWCHTEPVVYQHGSVLMPAAQHVPLAAKHARARMCSRCAARTPSAAPLSARATSSSDVASTPTRCVGCSETSSRMMDAMSSRFGSPVSDAAPSANVAAAAARMASTIGVSWMRTMSVRPCALASARKERIATALSTWLVRRLPLPRSTSATGVVTLAKPALRPRSDRSPTAAVLSTACANAGEVLTQTLAVDTAPQRERATRGRGGRERSTSS